MNHVEFIIERNAWSHHTTELELPVKGNQNSASFSTTLGSYAIELLPPRPDPGGDWGG